MRAILIVSALLLVGLMALPSASAANVMITVKPPTLPIPWDQPTVLDVTVEAACSAVAQENQAGRMEVELALADDYPPWIPFTGTKAAFNANTCDAASASKASSCTPQPGCASNYPSVTTTGKVTLTPMLSAPGLEPFQVKVIAKTQTGQAPVNLSIAWHGNLSSVTNSTDLVAGLDGNATFILSLKAMTNGYSMIMFTTTENPKNGILDGLPPTVDVTPPASPAMVGMSMPGDNDVPSVIVDVPLVFRAPTKPWTGDNVTISAQLMSYVDSSLVSEPLEVRFSFSPNPETLNSKKDSSGVGVGFVILAAIGLALVRRRNGEPRA